MRRRRITPLAAYMQVAACVPSTSTALETPGAVIGPEEVAEALGWGEDVISLGEVMNFPGVVFGDEKMHGEISAALRAGKVAGQHFAWPPTTGDSPPTPRAALPAATRAPPPRTQLGAFVRHVRQAAARLRLARRGGDHKGTHGDGARSPPHPARHRRPHPESLVEEGHVNFVVRHAIQQGVRPVTAFQMATLNAAERFGVWRDVGSVTPGRCADIILLEGSPQT